MARLTILSWNIGGQCDVRAMTYVINAYLRRHDTYRSWFEFDDDDRVVRHTIPNPNDVKFVATKHGHKSSRDWCEDILATPGPLEWDCFRFGIIQRADHFTFYMSVDHLHVDAMFIGLLFVEIHMMYAALIMGSGPIPLPLAGSYDAYCLRQHQYTSMLTIDSPQVSEWIEFAQRNDGTLPRFPLPIGDPSLPCEGDLMTFQLMDEVQSDRFEKACTAAGARFIGGVFAGIAMAEHQLTGNTTYHTITPTSTRAPEEMMTTGWFTGTVPITVPVNPYSFAETVRAAQASFDSGQRLGHVPFDRVLELALHEGHVRRPDVGVPMISYLDATVSPFSPEIVAQWNLVGGKIYSEMGAANQVGMWVNRFGDGTTVTVAFPNNPIARESVTRYLSAMRSAFVGVADGRRDAASSSAPLIESLGSGMA